MGIDLGTSYFKVGLFDREGRLYGLARVAAPVRADGPRREMNPDEFWAALRQAVGEALTAAGATVPDVAAMSYASQANTFLLVDELGVGLTPLISWADERA